MHWIVKDIGPPNACQSRQPINIEAAAAKTPESWKSDGRIEPGAARMVRKSHRTLGR
jgi:hypothetical protein